MNSFYVPHARVGLDTGEFTFTMQSAKDECDINNILKQYKRTGIIAHINAQQGEYLDLPSDTELQTSINVVTAAEQAFAELPAVIRDKYDNDPLRFLKAAHDPANRSEFEELGIIRKKDALDVAVQNLQSAAVP